MRNRKTRITRLPPFLLGSEWWRSRPTLSLGFIISEVQQAKLYAGIWKLETAPRGRGGRGGGGRLGGEGRRLGG